MLVLTSATGPSPSGAPVEEGVLLERVPAVVAVGPAGRRQRRHVNVAGSQRRYIAHAARRRPTGEEPD